MEEPFEPMDRASLKYVTLKMVCLVALATAQRRSELHALSYENFSFNKEMGEVQLASVPGFLAKNQAPNTSRHLVIIPSLSATVDKTFPDITLCPVRALKFYVDRTRPPTFRRGRQHLFMSYVEGYSKQIQAFSGDLWTGAINHSSKAATGDIKNHFPGMAHGSDSLLPWK
jgi:hypothetical protein